MSVIVNFISEYFIWLISSYIIGSIPFGLILTKIFAKKDIRLSGSGNIGATNVLRSAGKKLGYVTFLLDAMKGYIILFIANYAAIENSTIFAVMMLFVVLGHIFPIWLKFKGGKGVATFLGCILFFDPVIFVALLLGWYIVYYITRMVSFASILVMLVICLYHIIGIDVSSIMFVICSLIVIIKHKDNIKRILSGEEYSFKKPS